MQPFFSAHHHFLDRTRVHKHALQNNQNHWSTEPIPKGTLNCRLYCKETP